MIIVLVQDAMEVLSTAAQLRWDSLTSSVTSNILGLFKDLSGLILCLELCGN